MLKFNADSTKKAKIARNRTLYYEGALRLSRKRFAKTMVMALITLNTTPAKSTFL